MAILSEAPKGAKVLDLGAARIARTEARTATGEALPVIKLAAGYVEVKPEVDILSAEDFAAGHIRAGLAKLLADPADIDALVADGITKDDLDAIATFITGASLGE